VWLSPFGVFISASSLAEKASSCQCKETDHSEADRSTATVGLRSWIAQISGTDAKVAICIRETQFRDWYAVSIFARVLRSSHTTPHRSIDADVTPYRKSNEAAIYKTWRSTPFMISSVYLLLCSIIAGKLIINMRKTLIDWRNYAATTTDLVWVYMHKGLIIL